MQLIECAANFSEGRDKSKIAAIGAAIEAEGAKVLHADMGHDANRTVLTFAGAGAAVCEAAFAAIKRASELIDMRHHRGAHPRLGAADVVPFIPLAGCTLQDCAQLARALAQRVYERLGIPTYLYEAAATGPRKNLAEIRAGEYEALPQKLATPALRPDFGPQTMTLQAARGGATIIGARDFLLAVNFDLNTTSVAAAQDIARAVRASNGGMAGVKAIGWYMQSYGCAQVSTNIVDMRAAPLFEVYKEVCRQAHARGLEVTGTEVIGLLPKAAFAGVSAQDIKKMGLSNRSPFIMQERIIENLL